MRTVLGIILILSVYIIVYYRLMVRFEYEKIKNTKESTFGALFSFPPYSSLSEKGKTYAKKYWLGITVVVTCIGYLAINARFVVQA